jgi:U3 small nucleolar RNA-associated protein 4
VRAFDISLASYLAQHDLALGGHHVVFTPSSDKLIVVTVESKILIIDLSHWEQEQFQILAEFGHHHHVVQHRKVPQTVINIAVSEDGQWLATNDDQNNTFVYSLDNLKVTENQPTNHKSLNSFSPCSVTLSFLDL